MQGYPTIKEEDHEAEENGRIRTRRRGRIVEKDEEEQEVDDEDDDGDDRRTNNRRVKTRRKSPNKGKKNTSCYAASNLGSVIFRKIYF